MTVEQIRRMEKFLIILAQARVANFGRDSNVVFIEGHDFFLHDKAARMFEWITREASNALSEEGGHDGPSLKDCHQGTIDQDSFEV